MTPSLLLLIPPLTQLNTPYPSTAYLTGFLRARGYAVHQADLGIEMVLAVFSRAGLARVFDAVRALGGSVPGEARQMLALETAYLDTIEPVVAFLQGRDLSLAPRICQGRFLPQGPRFASRSRVPSPSGIDQAKYLATLYLEDLADLVHETVAPQFALSRYAEHVGVSATRFDTVLRASPSRRASPTSGCWRRSGGTWTKRIQPWSVCLYRSPAISTGPFASRRP